MTTALYRRYRPESFGEMIGQAQVTEPLMTALRGDRVGHAYLFSGPRGCGKTTSARILARCLNCAQGPTDTPCGECDSCVELGRGGGGSLDVVEIDAASHNGVDDARDLRERAIFAPARDRFKIFILDEAHMVTPQGFNALLKLVEEPPDHVKFIFATTEPEKVIGTIRSRTHHYPFRLVPPAAMLAYVEELCATEGVDVQPGVLPLVVRAGGGSPRDTLSLLDQLIAGSEDAKVSYSRAVALLGYTHGELLDEVVDAFAGADASAAFAAVDRVVQTGQDPRRFVDDLLERLRDLIIVEATGQGASAVLRGVSAEDLARMSAQAGAFGAARLSRTADLVVSTLDEMSGATSPRLQLELMVARVLASSRGPAAPAAVAPAAEAPAAVAPAAAAPAAAPAPAAVAPAAVAEAAPVVAPPAASIPVPAGPVTLARLRAEWPGVLAALEGISRSSWMLAMATQPLQLDETDGGHVLTLGFQSTRDIDKFKPKALGGTDAHVDVRQAIKDTLGIDVRFLPRVGGGEPPAAPARDAADDAPPPPDDPDPGYEPYPDPGPEHDPAPEPPRLAEPPRRPEPPRQAAPVTEWAVATIPGGAGEGIGASGVGATVAQLAVDDEPEDAATPAAVSTTAPREGDVLPARDIDSGPARDDDDPDADDVSGGASVESPVPPVVVPPIVVTPTVRSRDDGVQRYGEAVVRQVLGATFVREEPYEPPARFS